MSLTFVLAKDMESKEILNFWKKNGITISPTDNEKELKMAAKINPDLFLVALDNDAQVMGTVWGTFDGRRGYIIHLAVERSFRGKGLGKQLMQQLEVAFHTYGIYKAHIFVEKHNAKVIDFYKKLGYSVREDLTILSKILQKK